MLIESHEKQCLIFTSLMPMKAAIRRPMILMPAKGPVPSRHNSLHTVAHTPKLAAHLSVAPQGEGVVALPGLSASTLRVVVTVALVETTRLLASCGEATRLAVLVDWVDDPVDAGIAADGLVLRVDEDDLEVLVGGVLVDPVGVEDAEVGAAATDTLLGSGTEGALVLELVDTLVGWLAVGGTLWRRSLATTTANTDAVDHVALLSLVALLSCQLLLPSSSSIPIQRTKRRALSGREGREARWMTFR